MNTFLSRPLRKHAVRLVALFLALGTCQAWGQSRRFLFWKVTSPTTTVYLLGSIHMGTPDFYPLPARMESAFAASKVLAVELNVKDMDPTSILGAAQEQGMYKEGDSLTHHISPQTSEALDHFCAKSGLPRAMFEGFKPWLAAMTINVLTFKLAGADEKLGIDVHFLDEAQPNQRIDELESADFQVTALSSGTEDEQQELLAFMLGQAESAEDSMQKMKETYLAGNENEIGRKLEESLPKSFYKRLVEDRNAKMASRIENYLRGSEPCFVVVGAGHLVGAKGIVKLLEDRSYHVERVTP